MYPDPHIPSAPTARVLEGGKAIGLSRRTLFLISGSIALVLLAALGVSVMQQANLQAQRDEAADSEDSIAVSDHRHDANEPRFSTRTHSTRLP